jgi:hypothetical protein
MPSYAEKRKHPRKVIEWPAEVRSSQGLTTGEMKNISVSGAYVQCTPLPECGEIITATVWPPRRKPVQVTAEVIWKAPVPPYGMGIAFTEISEEDRWFIAESVSRMNSGVDTDRDFDAD